MPFALRAHFSTCQPQLPLSFFSFLLICFSFTEKGEDKGWSTVRLKHQVSDQLLINFGASVHVFSPQVPKKMAKTRSPGSEVELLLEMEEVKLCWGGEERDQAALLLRWRRICTFFGPNNERIDCDLYLSSALPCGRI
ncbi:uncharacterized protein LOC110093427 [Dendrobium catenatum]|uniref:uncharacterized protein LOC110093427 n=1 Tax=Dendrobium catenatum TaxID=906689 RepID=UPI0010A06AF0|nr:uncharacterized protein LOC110093427 [Dendrobium catenatum]